MNKHNSGAVKKKELERNSNNVIMQNRYKFNYFIYDEGSLLLQNLFSNILVL